MKNQIENTHYLCSGSLQNPKKINLLKKDSKTYYNHHIVNIPWKHEQTLVHQQKQMGLMMSKNENKLAEPAVEKVASHHKKYDIAESFPLKDEKQ